MATFEFKNAQELGLVLARYQVKYLFLGKSGATLLGYSDTTQAVDLYVDKHRENCERLVESLLELGFLLTANEQSENGRGKNLIQPKNGS